jgi:hypothetical protein
MDHIVARLVAESAVALRQPACPADTEPLSASAAVTRPLPDPTLRLRSSAPGATVQLVVALDLSAQYDTSALPEVATGTNGVVRVVPDVVPKLTSSAVTALALR